MKQLRDHILEAGVLEPDGGHHVLAGGMHGQKLNFGVIRSESDLYKEWVEANEATIKKRFRMPPAVIIGVADGTNPLALDVARQFEGRSIGLTTERGRNAKKIRLTKLARRVIQAVEPDLVLVVEDVGTAGTNAVQVARELLASGAKHVEVQITWQRRAKLERLEEHEIPYYALINQPLPTYEPEECQRSGLCAEGWDIL